uniref:Ribosomal protein L6 n=2 Tax=Chromera velia TaxID=505693 RepID=D9IXF5_9ALVE|nr:ribosomal protein L6 [Chromera velia]ADJ66563.1 ribosomal protein L6 [Chromera velia]
MFRIFTLKKHTLLKHLIPKKTEIYWVWDYHTNHISLVFSYDKILSCTYFNHTTIWCPFRQGFLQLEWADFSGQYQTLYKQLLKSWIKASMNPYNETLILNGIGYNAKLVSGLPTERKTIAKRLWFDFSYLHSSVFTPDLAPLILQLELGYSHRLNLILPKTLNLQLRDNNIGLSSADKVLVGLLSSAIRQLRKPEPYKGKGIKYSNEVVMLKIGKKR